MSSKSNIELTKYLTNSNDEIILSIIEMMDSVFLRKKNKFKKEYKTPEEIPSQNSDERAVLSSKIVHQLSYFGTHSFTYPIYKFFDGQGVSYKEILRDVLKRLKKQLGYKKNIPKVATVKDYEFLVCQILMQAQFANKTEDQIIEMLEESGLGKDAIEQSIKEFIKIGAGGGAILKLVKILGKKTVKEMIQSMVVWLLAKKIGKEAAVKFAERILKKNTQKRIAKIVSGIGWVFLAKDAVDLGKPATRITIPCVSFISAVRTIESL